MKKIIALLLVLVMAFSMVACAGTQEEAPQTESAYATALDVFTPIWDNMPEDFRFAAFGGNQNENAVMDAPGAFDLTDTDGLSYLLLLPEAVQSSIDDAASLVHMMNANTFTGAIVRVADGSTEDVAAQIKEAVVNNQFMCGFPEKLIVMSLDNYVLYAFGLGDVVNAFRDTASNSLSGSPVVLYEEVMG